MGFAAAFALPSYMTYPKSVNSTGRIGGKMSEEIIGMDDMVAIYEVTDRFDIDRETVSVPLEKVGDGSVTANNDGSIEIVAPASMTVEDWQPTLEAAIRELGFSTDDDSDWWS